MTPSSPDTVAAEPADRRTGLVLFGILDVLVAFQYLVKTIAIALIAFTGAKPHVGTVPVGGSLPLSAFLALVPLGFFLSIGIGSAVGRRWARSLSLAFSWVWLGFGTVTAIGLCLCLPKLAAAGGDKAPFVAYLLTLFFGILLPSGYLLFYRSPSVKGYCEWLDAEERWTDRCPVSILAMMILLVIGAQLAIGIGFSPPRQILFFGRSFGWSVRLGCIAIALFELAVAWSLYRRRLWAWLAAVAMMIFRGAVSIAIALNLTVDRFSYFVHKVSPGGLNRKDAAELEALRALHPTAALTAYVAVLALLELGFVIWAGRWVRAKAGPPVA